MDRNQTLDRLAMQADAVRAMGATSLYLFGSTARGEAGGRGDLVVFIEYDPKRKFSLFDLVEIKLLLEDRLGIEVDLTTRDGLHPCLRERIEQSAIRVF